MDTNTKKLIEELNKLKGQLSERFIFGDDEGQEQQMGEDPGMGGEDKPNPVLVQQQSQQQMMQGNSEEEIAMHAQEIIQHEPIIGKIRETAIEGLKKYADHPTSTIYEFFKKVFLESDKVLTDTGNKR